MNTSTTSPQRVFISYRREDSAAYAGRLYDSMVARFGEDNVFMDVEMEPGIDFVERINEVVSSCAALIVVIGPRWATIEGEDGNPRLHDETDFVRHEVTAACRRADVTVIPALVGKAQMPRAEQLPEDLRPLARRNALELSDGRWRYDVGRLNSTLDTLLDGYTGFGTQRPSEPLTLGPQTLVPPPAEPSAPALPVARMLLEGVLIAAVTAFLVRWVVDTIPHADTNAGEIAGVLARRAITWGLIGAVIGGWLGLRGGRIEVVRAALLGLLVGLVGGALGGVIWALPVYLPAEEPSIETKESLEIVATAVTGIFFGGLSGALWWRRDLVAGMASGLIAGALAQVLLNAAGIGGPDMPDVGIAFGLRAALITLGVLGTLLALDRSRAVSRSSAAARAPAGR